MVDSLHILFLVDAGVLQLLVDAGVLQRDTVGGSVDVGRHPLWYRGQNRWQL